MQANQTGVFYANLAAAGIAAFPRQYRRRAFSQLDRRFMLVVAACALGLGLPTFILSYVKPPVDLSAREIRKIQERYAQLVLNQPKPEEAKEDEGKGAEQAGTEKVEKVDRSKESYVDKERRRESNREQRSRRMERISREVGTSGIFAAITAASGSGGAIGAGGVSDLLGATDVVSGLAGISVSRGTFATRNVDPATLTGRRGTATTGVGIEVAEVGRAESRQIASGGTASITSEPPQISGDESQVKSSQACIQSVINVERSKIKRVYETWLKRDPQLGGKIKVRFTILANGTVGNAAAISSTTGNGRFDENVVRYVARWDFSGCSVGSAMEVELPFVFEGQS